MPPHNLQDVQVAGVVAYLRSSATSGRAVSTTGNAARGKTLFEGKGACTQCHRVVEFDGCTVDALAHELSEQTRFRIQGHWLELFGLCPECQAA